MQPAVGQPTALDWASANLIVNKHEETKPPILELRKQLTKDGREYTQSIWLTIHQLRSVATDLAL